jgi:hypothetical protein
MAENTRRRVGKPRRDVEEYFIEPGGSNDAETTILPKDSSQKLIKSFKRSSSESNIRPGPDNYTTLFKSRSSRNLLNERNNPNSLKTYIKNRNAINIYDTMPNEHMPPLFIINQNEVKKKFLESNVPPYLKVNRSLVKEFRPFGTHQLGDHR